MFLVSYCEVILEEQFVVGSCNLFFFSLEFGRVEKGEIIDFFSHLGTVYITKIRLQILLILPHDICIPHQAWLVTRPTNRAV